jgi:hypothetical protein
MSNVRLPGRFPVCEMLKIYPAFMCFLLCGIMLFLTIQDIFIKSVFFVCSMVSIPVRVIVK